MMEILKKNIEELITPKLDEMNLFLVDVVIGANFKIQVFADGIPSITIKQCTELSRFLESYLDEEASVPEKYTLEVSSPGMTNPLRVNQQYKKRIGSTLKITLNNGDQVAMILKEVNNDTLFGLRTKIEEKKTKKPIKKINEEDLESISIDLSDIKQALLHFNF
jgi:ribosome maturation factor RimP